VGGEPAILEEGERRRRGQYDAGSCTTSQDERRVMPQLTLSKIVQSATRRRVASTTTLQSARNAFDFHANFSNGLCGASSLRPHNVDTKGSDGEVALATVIRNLCLALPNLTNTYMAR
jgi:hypothetical protein